MIATADRPVKPKFGAPCNGCGICCQLERCHFSVEILGAGPGPCPALEDQNGRAWCGLLRQPTKYMGDAPFVTSGTSVGRFQVAFASALAIGRGCDSDDEAVRQALSLLNGESR